MLVGIDAVNVMAAYQPVVQACATLWRNETSVGIIISVLILIMHGANMKISDGYPFFFNVLLPGKINAMQGSISHRNQGDNFSG